MGRTSPNIRGEHIDLFLGVCLEAIADGGQAVKKRFSLQQGDGSSDRAHLSSLSTAWRITCWMGPFEATSWIEAKDANQASREDMRRNKNGGRTLLTRRTTARRCQQ
jgi:hypothetical protein